MALSSDDAAPTRTPFVYTPRNLELSEDQTWVCVSERTGHVSIEDERKFGAKDDLLISVDDDGSILGDDTGMVLRIKGKSTYKVKEEIKSLANDDRVDDVYWVADLSCWAVISKNADSIHSLVISVRTFLHACVVVRLKLTYEKRLRQAVSEGRGRKRSLHVEKKSAL